MESYSGVVRARAQRLGCGPDNGAAGLPSACAPGTPVQRAAFAAGHGCRSRHGRASRQERERPSKDTRRRDQRRVGTRGPTLVAIGVPALVASGVPALVASGVLALVASGVPSCPAMEHTALPCTRPRRPPVPPGQGR